MLFFDKVRVKSKFLFAMATILIVMVVSSLFTLFMMSGQERRTENLLAAATLSESVFEREVQHLQWVNRLSSYLVGPGDAALTLQKDSSKCAFGLWYYGAQKEQTLKNFPEVAGPLRAIEQPHNALHQSAVEIERLHRAGNTKEAYRVFGEKTLIALDAVQKEFAALRSAVGTVVEREKIETQQSATSAKIGASVFGLLVCVVVIGSTLTLLKSVFKPIDIVTRYAQDCSDGKENTLTIHRQDELGVLADSLRKLMGSLGEQLAFSRGVLHGITVPCSVFSPEDKTVFTNMHMVDLLERGGRPEDYTGMVSGEYIWGDKNQPTLSTRALHEKKTLTAERDFATFRGNKRHAAISSAPIYNEKGVILGTLSIWMDLTEIKRQQATIEANNKRITEVAVTATDVAGNLSSSSAELAVQVEQANKGAETQRNRVSQTAIAMGEMVATVTEVARGAEIAAKTTAGAKEKALEGAEVVDIVIKSIKDLAENASKVKVDMDELAQKSEGIGAIINVINDIADQTNLLALNAAIEAARAGEAGRGFAVVADEVRKLAEKTMDATKEVTHVIQGIQKGSLQSMVNVELTAKAVEEASTQAYNAGESLKSIVGLVETAAEQVHGIATAAEEQAASTEEVKKTLEEVDQISAETSHTMSEAAVAVDELANQASNLNRLIDSLK